MAKNKQRQPETPKKGGLTRAINNQAQQETARGIPKTFLAFLGKS